MNELKLIVENQRKNYQLKPGREYILGSGENCTLSLPYSKVSDPHLKISFNPSNSVWYFANLDNIHGTFVNGQKIGNSPYPIQSETRILMGDSATIVVVPELTAINNSGYPTPSVNHQSNPLPSPPVHGTPSGQVELASSHGNGILQRGGQQAMPRSGNDPLVQVAWKDFIKSQVDKQPNWICKVVTRFSLATGFRNTPWISKFNGYTLRGGSSLSAFEGYIIPDFSGSENTVRDIVQSQVGQLRQYKDTDCYITELTDAHIADSATQKFLGVELFAIKRANQSDWRKFCVASYHRVRTYLLIENYGSDLFVSWVTRFEPDPSPIPALLWLIAASLSTLVLISNAKNFFAFTIPLAIWLILYLFIPYLMLTFDILPKKANARLLIALTLGVYLFLDLSMLLGTTALFSSGRSSF
jgi:FHA domain